MIRAGDGAVHDRQAPARAAQPSIVGHRNPGLATRRAACKYCPVAKATEILGDRWTLLIVREMLGRPSGFN